MFSKLEEPRAWLHVTGLVNHDDTQHASAVCVFFLREFAKEMKQTLVVRFKANGLDFCD